MKRKNLKHRVPGSSSPLTVLHLISSRGLYGAERVALELCKSLKDLGCKPIIGAIRNSHNPHTEIIEEAKKSAIETVVFPCTGQFDRKALRAIREFITSQGIDVINSHGYKSNFYGFFASRSGTPIVATNHNWLTSHWKLRLYCRLDSLWMRSFDRIVAVSDGVKDTMLQYGLRERQIDVIDNGVDLSRFNGPVAPAAVRRELGVPEDARIIGTVASLTPEKGQIYLLQASASIVRKHNDVFVVFVGEGPLRRELEQESLRLGMAEQTRFPGFRNDVPGMLSAMDMFVLPSIKEGLPMVLLEAMAAGKPVIASRVGAIPKVVNGNNGMLVEPGDVPGLAASMNRLLNDRESALRMAAAGRETVKSGYSSETMAAKYYRLYEALFD